MSLMSGRVRKRQMQCEKTFCFQDESEKIEVIISESTHEELAKHPCMDVLPILRVCSSHRIIFIVKTVDPKYGMFTWPSAPVLAQYIWHNRVQVREKNVLELGSGTSLSGIVAALCGAKVTLTDAEEFPECLQNCRRICLANNLTSVNVIGLTWGQFSPEVFKLPPVDFLLGSDCFYDIKDFDDILATVSYFMDKNPIAKFWTTYQVRR